MNFFEENIHRLPLKTLMIKKVEIMGWEPHIRALQIMGYPAGAILVDLDNKKVWARFFSKPLRQFNL